MFSPRYRPLLAAGLLTAAGALTLAGLTPVPSAPQPVPLAARVDATTAGGTAGRTPQPTAAAPSAGGAPAVTSPADTRRSADARTADAATNRPALPSGAVPPGPSAAGSAGTPAELAGRAAVPVLVKGSKAPRSGNLAPRSYTGSDLPSPGATPSGPTTGTPAPAGCGGSLIPKDDGGYWTCSFDDEFDGTSLDRSTWVVQTTAASGFHSGQECFVDTPNNVSVGGGLLRLTVREEAADFTCPRPQGAYQTRYTSGSVMTFGTFSQTYGRFEVRAQLPATAVQGLQETLWLWPVDQFRYGLWPASGEIDFGEFYSKYAGWNIPYIHYTYDKATTSWATDTNVVTALPAPYNQPGRDCRIDQAGFNTYTLTWAPGRITIQVNGKDCIVNNYRPSNVAAPAPFDQPFFLSLTQALGIGDNAFRPGVTPLPATTAVDYVRVWK